nr:hypothetical protein [Tanacetum cinerariifolium]
GDDDDDDGDDLLEDDADDEDEEESSDSKEEEEEHLALTIPAPALHSFVSASEDSDQTEPFEEGETAATPPPLGYLSPTSYPLPPFLMPLPIFTLLPPPPPPIILPRTRASMVLMKSTAPSTFILAPRSRAPPIGTPPLLPIPLPTISLPLLLPSTSGSESIPEGDIPLRKRARFTTPTGGYEEVAYSRDYCTQIMDYCQLREVHTITLVTQIKALQRDVSTLKGHQIDDEDRLTRRIQYEHAQRDVTPEDGDSCS